MSTRSQRGRAVQKKQAASLRTIYLVLGALVVVALAAGGIYALQNQAGPAAPAGIVPGKPAPSAPVGTTAEGYYFKGQESAPVTVVKFSDYQCPGCAYYANSLGQAFDQEFVDSGRVKFVYQEYPLRGHSNAVPAAEAARCAGDQGAYWRMHDFLFTNQRQWGQQAQPINQFTKYAEQIGIDAAAFRQCMSSGTHRQEILAAQAAGDQVGVSGTPSFAVNGQMVDTTGAQSVEDIAARMRAAVSVALGQ